MTDLDSRPATLRVERQGGGTVIVDLDRISTIEDRQGTTIVTFIDGAQVAIKETASDFFLRAQAKTGQFQLR